MSRANSPVNGDIGSLGGRCPELGSPDVPVTAAAQSSEDALAQDIALIAGARGWTSEEAEAAYRVAEIVGGIAQKVATERPDIFVGSVLPPEPLAVPELYIKGPADESVRGLVAAAGIEIKLVDNQPYSFDELDERKTRVARALQAQGFRYISAVSSVAGGGTIEAAVARQDGLPASAEQILLGLPSDLRESVELAVRDDACGWRDDLGSH